MNEFKSAFFAGIVGRAVMAVTIEMAQGSMMTESISDGLCAQAHVAPDCLAIIAIIYAVGFEYVTSGRIGLRALASRLFIGSAQAS